MAEEEEEGCFCGVWGAEEDEEEVRDWLGGRGRRGRWSHGGNKKKAKSSFSFSVRLLDLNYAPPTARARQRSLPVIAVGSWIGFGGQRGSGEGQKNLRKNLLSIFDFLIARKF